MNTKEAAEYLGLKEQTLRVNRMRSHRTSAFIPYRRDGHAAVYDKRDLDAWLRARTQKKENNWLSACYTQGGPEFADAEDLRDAGIEVPR